MSDKEKISVLLQVSYPNLQDELFDYVNDILTENAEMFETVDEIKESIEDILKEVDSSKSDEDIRSLCENIFGVLNIQNNAVKEPILLNNPICISDIVEKQKPLEFNGYGKIDIMKINDIPLIDDDIIRQNLAKAEESRLKKQKKKVEEMHTLLISQQFNKNSSLSGYVADGNDCENGQTSLVNFVVDNFDMSFGSKVLLKEASMSIAIGRRYGFVGRNGLGKSTLLKAMHSGDLKLPAKVTVLLVEQEVIGDDTKAIDSVLESDIVRHRLLTEMQRLTVSNNNNNSQISRRLLEIYQELEKIESDKAPTRAAIILKGLGFTDEMQQMPTSTFSGGWRMRLSLAKALFRQPDLLLLDEPTNMLDMKATIWLEEYLKKWKRSLIVVSHDQKFLDSIATDILHLNSLKIEHYKCNFSQFLVARENKLKAQIKEYQSQQEFREHIQRFIDRFRCYANRASQVQSKIKMLEKLPVLEMPEREVKVQFDFPCCSQLTSTVIRADDVCFSYDGKRNVINNMNMSVGAGCRICIVGENGAGKSTLLKLIMGQLEPNSGMLRIHKNARFGYFCQHHVDQLDVQLSSLEFLQTTYPGFEQEVYRSRLGYFGITGEIALRPIHSLSGGQKSRVAFAILFLRNPNFLILDEPTNHLDMQTITALAEAIKKFSGDIVLVSHDERLINEVCRELWLVEKNGQVSVVDGGIDRYKEMLLRELEC